MKLKSIIYSLAGLALCSAMASCEGEKDLVIIEGNLPIKASALYMVGDATPNGWSIDAPTPFEATGEDPLVFTWEGTLRTGEMKLCLITGSWDAPFIRPLANGTEISSTDITDAEFQMHAGDPDEKWVVKEAGDYQLTFDLRNWKMSTHWLGAGSKEPVTKDPIAADAVYIVGDATPNGWNIDAPTLLDKKSDYIFEYDGILLAGEMKACIATGDWGAPFIRPSSANVEINRDGVAASDFIFEANPDDKWLVTVPGTYHLVFDLQNYTITAEFKGEYVVEKNPIESDTLYMIGDATPGGWSMDDATPFTQSASDKYVFTWTGTLVPGNMKACLEPDGTFSCPFLRPSTAGCEINASGVAAADFVYTTNPDDQWTVTKTGTYTITFNLRDWTISVVCNE